jgi:pilus assembly protein Flp/PilA
MLTRRGLRDDTGASAVEYGLLIAAVAAVTVIVLFALGGAVQGLFSKSCDAIDSQVTATAECSP